MRTLRFILLVLATLGHNLLFKHLARRGLIAFAADPDADVATLAQELKRATDEVKNLGEDIKKKYDTGATVSQELKDKADQALTGMNGLKERIAEVEQRLVRQGGPELAQYKSAGDRFIADERVQAMLAAKSGRVRVEVKDISSVTTDTDGAAGAAVVPHRVPGIVTPPQQRLTVRGLLMPGNTSSNAIQYVQETGFTNAAAPVAEGQMKPESSLKLADITVPVQTIAHWVRATKQILDDAPQLASHIDGRLRYGLALREEAQLLFGDGTGQNLHGIVPQATAYADPISLTGATVIDMIRLAMLQATLAEYPATGTVMNHADWARIELTKDSEGRYIIGNPQQGTQPMLWGLPLVPTAAMTADKFLVGAFQMAAQVFDRQDATVEVSTEDRDNFVTNRVTIRAEERLALAVYRPEAFIYGDFGNTTP